MPSMEGALWKWTNYVSGRYKLKHLYIDAERVLIEYMVDKPAFKLIIKTKFNLLYNSNSCFVLSTLVHFCCIILEFRTYI